jgi:hypothetical protein
MLGKLLGLFRTRRSTPGRPSATRKPSACRRARLALEELESRFVPTTGVGLYSHLDPVTHMVDYEITCFGTGNTVSIDHGNTFGVGYLQVTGLKGTILYNRTSGPGYQPPVGTTFTYQDSLIGQIWVESADGGNSIFIHDIVRPLEFQSFARTDYGAPTDHVYLGGPTLQGIQANVTLLDSQGTLSVDVNGQNDTVSRSVMLGASSPQPDPISEYYAGYPLPVITAQCGAITGLVGQASDHGPTIYYQTSNISNLALQLGPGYGAPGYGIYVANTYVDTTIINEGVAFVEVGSSGTTQGIQGGLHVSNTVAHDTWLYVDDSSDTAFRSVYVGQVVGFNNQLQVAPVIYGSLMPSSISYDPGSLWFMTVATGTGGAIVLDSDFSTPTSLVGAPNATNILLEQIPWAPLPALCRAGSGYANLSNNVSYTGF